MSGWRIAKHDELARLWPAARSAHVASSLRELQSFYEKGPWRVRVSSAGDAMVLARWRSHLDILAIRGLWVAEHRVGPLLTEAKAVARAQGFSDVISPLLSRALHRPYLLEGMCELEPIVALQGVPGRLALRAVGEPGPDIRLGTTTDLDDIARIDAACFDDFWVYGTEEIATVIDGERLTVAIDAGEVRGYASAAIRGHTCTLGRLAVAPEARRRGLGRALVSDVARWAAESGATTLSLCTQESNSTSRALYRACGLFEVEERYGILATPSE